ncbi:hypothetical protein FHG87_017229 [Trinorchestia longiramus]|nr:hypothetical protein FHG87_017229 [Trinorchestia longiramus]
MVCPQEKYSITVVLVSRSNGVSSRKVLHYSSACESQQWCVLKKSTPLQSCFTSECCGAFAALASSGCPSACQLTSGYGGSGSGNQSSSHASGLQDEPSVGAAPHSLGCNTWSQLQCVLLVVARALSCTTCSELHHVLSATPRALISY